MSVPIIIAIISGTVIMVCGVMFYCNPRTQYNLHVYHADRCISLKIAMRLIIFNFNTTSLDESDYFFHSSAIFFHLSIYSNYTQFSSLHIHSITYVRRYHA